MIISNTYHKQGAQLLKLNKFIIKSQLANTLLQNTLITMCNFTFMALYN